jgi:hypothetical protein
MENNFDVALMEEDTNKVTLHNTREDYNRVTHGPEERRYEFHKEFESSTCRPKSCSKTP